jgi:hypothetical protein
MDDPEAWLWRMGVAMSDAEESNEDAYRTGEARLHRTPDNEIEEKIGNKSLLCQGIYVRSSDPLTPSGIENVIFFVKKK